MKIRYISLVFTILAIVTCKKNGEPSTTKNNSDERIISKIDSIANSFIESGKVMGLSIAVLKKGETFYNKGFGYVDSAKAKPVQNDHIFLMASISKLIGATVVMKLVDERKLSLDQTLYELLPDYPNREQAEKITLRHLISHTSGLPEYSKVIDTIYVREGKEPTRDDYFDFFKETPSLFEPGDNYRYNNSGFILMAMIVEKVSGTSFQSEIDRIINRPLDISIKLIREATNNPKTTKFFELKDTIFHDMSHWKWIKGDGGLTATAIDLAQFPYKWSDGTLISKKSYQQMITPVVLNDGIKTGYGLGTRTGIFEGETVLGHTGGHNSTWSRLIYFPDKDMVLVVFVNTDNTSSNAFKLSGLLSLALLEKEMPDYTNITRNSEDLSKYTGLYRRPDDTEDRYISIYLNKEDDHLYYKYAGNDSKGEKMYHLGNGEFWIERWPTDRVIFDVDAENQARAIKEYYYGYYVNLRKKIK